MNTLQKGDDNDDDDDDDDNNNNNNNANYLPEDGRQWSKHVAGWLHVCIILYLKYICNLTI